MSDKPWYPRYPRDFRAKTIHLNLTERGAYDALIDHYYELRTPLPREADALYRICGAFTEQDRAAVDRVAKEFFENGKGGLSNKRCDEEIAKMKARSEQQAELANRRWHKDGNAKAYAKASPTAYASHSHSHKEQKPLAPPGAFEQFWLAYPRKKSKGQAEKAWAKHANGNIEQIMAALSIATKSDDWAKEGGKFIPYPATWLNAKGWLDEQLAQKSDGLPPLEQCKQWVV